MWLRRACGVQLVNLVVFGRPVYCIDQHDPRQGLAGSPIEDPAIPIVATWVAVCFVGQFLRGASGHIGVARFRDHFSPGFSADAKYDAYIATSTQVRRIEQDGGLKRILVH